MNTISPTTAMRTAARLFTSFKISRGSLPGGDASDLVACQLEVERGGILPHVLGTARLGNREQRRPAGEEVQDDLPWRDAPRPRDLGHHARRVAAPRQRR